MCECNLIVERRTGKPIEIAPAKHDFSYVKNGEKHVLLDGLDLSGVINYAAAHEIRDSHGVKRGYMFIVGEAIDPAAATIAITAAE